MITHVLCVFAVAKEFQTKWGGMGVNECIELQLSDPKSTSTLTKTLQKSRVMTMASGTVGNFHKIYFCARRVCVCCVCVCMYVCI